MHPSLYRLAVRIHRIIVQEVLSGRCALIDGSYSLDHRYTQGLNIQAQRPSPPHDSSTADQICGIITAIIGPCGSDLSYVLPSGVALDQNPTALILCEPSPLLSLRANGYRVEVRIGTRRGTEVEI